MKKRVLRGWVKRTIVILFVVATIIIAHKLDQQSQRSFNECQKEHSTNYCYKLIYGN